MLFSQPVTLDIRTTGLSGIIFSIPSSLLLGLTLSALVYHTFGIEFKKLEFPIKEASQYAYVAARHIWLGLWFWPV